MNIFRTMMMFFLTLLFGLLLSGCDSEESTQGIIYEDSEYSFLVFTKTSGWRHDSIEDGKQALMQIAHTNGFSVTFTEEADYFTSPQLAEYDAVVFLNTTETIFEDDQREAFKNYINSGGGFVGVHSASDTEYNWPWYGNLVGAYFDNHPNNPNVREAELIVIDGEHSSTEILPELWIRSDEWYNFSFFSEGINVLIELNTDSYRGSDHPGAHPIAWYHEYDGGRSFYTGLGHTKESYSEELFLQHLEGGLKYAMDIK